MSQSPHELKRVICIDDSNIANYPGELFPNGPVVKGETYHVAAILRGKGLSDGTDTYVLVEKPVANREPYTLSGWSATRFEDAPDSGV